MSEVEYDPLGGRVGVVGEVGYVVVGYRGGYHDPLTNLVMFEAGAKVYDPEIGRYVTPDYSGFLDNFRSLPWKPEELAHQYKAVFQDGHVLSSLHTELSTLTGD